MSLFRSAFHFPSCHCQYEGFFPVVHLKYDMRQDSVIDEQIISKSDVLATVEAKKGELEVLVTLGAGDIENFATEITTILKD